MCLNLLLCECYIFIYDILVVCNMGCYYLYALVVICMHCYLSLLEVHMGYKYIII